MFYFALTLTIFLKTVLQVRHISTDISYNIWVGSKFAVSLREFIATRFHWKSGCMKRFNVDLQMNNQPNNRSTSVCIKIMFVLSQADMCGGVGFS